MPRPVGGCCWVGGQLQAGRPQGFVGSFVAVDLRVKPVWRVCPPGTLPRFSQVPKCCRGPLFRREDGADCADGALLGDFRWRQRFRWEDLAQRPVQTFVSAEPSRAERSVPFSTHTQHLLAQIHRSLFLRKKKKNPLEETSSGHCTLQPSGSPCGTSPAALFPPAAPNN